MVSTVSEICLKLNVSQMSVRYRLGTGNVLCGLEVRMRGLTPDSSILFLALSLTHHVTLDQSTELSGKENRTDDIIDYLCSFHFQHVLKRGLCIFIPDKRPQLSI